MADAKRISRETETQWFQRWMRANNMPGKTPAFRIHVNRVESPKTLVEIIEKLARVGYRVDPAQIEERTGLRMAPEQEQEAA